MTTQSPIYQNVHREVLSNGLTTLIAKPNKSTQTVAAYLAVKTGAADEGRWLGAGLSHFVEHMFFKGTHNRDKGLIEKEVRRIGGDINAYTSHDLTVFYVTALAAEVDTAIDLLYDAAFHSILDADEMDREREVIVSEMRMNEDRLDRKVLLTLWNRMYTGHPYENPVIGYESVFRASTRDDLKSFMDQYYVPNNMVLSVVGDIDVNKASEIIAKTFGTVDRKSVEPVYRTQPIIQQSRRFTLVRKPAEHVRLMIGYPTPYAGHPDAPALDVLAEIFGGGADSRLIQEVKETEQAVVDISAFHSALKDGGLFAVDATVVMDKKQKALQSIDSHLEKLIENGVTQEEMDRAVTQILSQHYQSLETNASIAHELLFNEIVTGDYAFTQAYLSRLKSLNIADVKSVAVKYLLEHKRNQVELIPEQFKSSDMQFNEIKSDAAQSNLKIESQNLKNGIRVLIDEDDSNPLIHIQVALMGGVLYENDQTNGVGSILADMLTRGTKTATQADIAERFARWGGSISSYGGRNSFGLTLTFLKEYQEEAIELLADMMTEPLWSEEEFTKVRNESIEDLTSQKEDIFATATHQFHQLMYAEGHPYRLHPIGNEASLSAMTAKQAYEAYLSLRNPSSTVVGVSGAIEASEVVNLLNKKIGLISNPEQQAIMNTAEGFSTPATKTHPMEREQAVIMIGVPSIAIDHPDRYVLEVLNAILSGSAGKLYQYIRGEHGLSYVVGSSLSLGIVQGHFVAYAATAPHEAERVTQLLSEFLTEIASTGCSAEELALAKAQLAGHHLHGLESKSSRLPQFVSEELLGSGWQAVLNYPTKIEAITLDDVNQAFKRYLQQKEQRILITGKTHKETING